MLEYLGCVLLVHSIVAAPFSVEVQSNSSSVNNLLKRPKREFSTDDVHIIDDCIAVTSKQGHFFYKAIHPAADICGLYFITDPEEKIEIQIEYIDVSCRSGGVISVVDGWELNGEYFPSVEDHHLPLEDRIVSTCSEKGSTHYTGRRRFISSQNAALVQFHVPHQGESFSIRVQYIPNPTPCNILVEGTSETYTLTNHGRHWNCSVTTLFPAEIQIQSINVGTVPSRRLHDFEVETGVMHKCDKRRFKDYLQIGGSNGLDSSGLTIADTICGYKNEIESYQSLIGCGTSTVRLVSSGRFFNTALVGIRPADLDSLPFSDVICE
ncbi:corticotropin-releasing factor-binding protein-like [Artemia franciscana]|uniref:corticotropin-releasing factor-binding protein-like n=1 Tax=Artemia franciscana TaxID=6661 RepID=UPI0032DB88F5